ncbi:MAG TPA: exonuclease domain-containing protein [Bacteroidia bacterium]|nr:exonuclease domain-containing protein [Bacteroidia bacterium]
MFAIIDIETCGGSFEFRKGRITEICILKHDGLSVIDKFSSLINPECHISHYFSNLTGITNEMVEDAPKFHEVAAKIIEMTEGCVFVAHNVGFDYGFIKDEFNSLGYKYRRDTLCTVRLSRKLIPGRISYSLGHLCAALGIEIFGRHRAEGDAVATAQLFDRLMLLKSQHSQYKNMGLDELMSRRIDKIKAYVLKKLPEECGVYYFLNREGQIIYIGKSNNVYQRAIAHFNSDLKKSKRMLAELYNVDFVPTGSELIALLLESEEIKKHQPKFNRSRKVETFSHCIVCEQDELGILNLSICENDGSREALACFSSYGAARQRLDAWIEEQELCLRYCGLTSGEAVCFHHQIRKCKGICCGEEEVSVYNHRVEKILAQYRFPRPDFALVDKGRHKDEYSLILVENNRYQGYGYFEQHEQILSLEEIKGHVRYGKDYPDHQDLLRHFLRSGKGRYIPLGPSKGTSTDQMDYVDGY